MIESLPPRAVAALALVLLQLAPSPAGAEEEAEELGWFETAELSVVATQGNAESTTFGFDNTLLRVWEESRFKLELGGLRAETTDRSRSAVATSAGGFRVVEEEDTRLSAERYYLQARYEHELSPRAFWHAGAGWERNELAGIAHRISLLVGAGHTWVDREGLRFATDYGATYTEEEGVATGASSGFGGVRLAYDLARRLTGTTTWTSKLTVDESLEDGDDVRGDLTNALAVAINAHLALKVSLQLLYDHQPSLERIPLLEADGTTTGETVLVPLDELDGTLKVALVVDL